MILLAFPCIRLSTQDRQLDTGHGVAGSTWGPLQCGLQALEACPQQAWLRPGHLFLRGQPILLQGTHTLGALSACEG